MTKKTETKETEDGIELGSDFVDFFHKERDRKVAELEAGFADPAVRDMMKAFGLSPTEMDKSLKEFKDKIKS